MSLESKVLAHERPLALFTPSRCIDAHMPIGPPRHRLHPEGCPLTRNSARTTPTIMTRPVPEILESSLPGASDLEFGRDRPTVTGDPTVIFLHIGKTAGTTMRQVLRRNFRSPDVMVIRVRGRPREETLERFGDLPAEVRSRPRLIMGHTIYGLHEHVPRPSTYITIVRKPSSLVLSQYRFVLRTPGHRHHAAVTSVGMSIADYIRSGMSLEMDNSQTRAIAGDLSTPFGKCTNAMLERAKRNLDESFSVVGLTERFEETLILLQKTFGWSHLHYVRANVAPHGPSVELTDEVRDLIDEHNRLDNALYAHVSARFEEAMRSYPSFEHDLARFIRTNALYRTLGALTHTYPQRVASTIGLRRSGSRSSVLDL